MGAGLGQTGEVARLVPRYVDTEGTASRGPVSIVAKVATSNEARRKASMRVALYEREVNFYKHVADKVSLKSPRSYFADVDPDGEFFMLLLEDFPHHRAGDQIEGTSRDEAVLGIEQLAKLHAPFWNKPLPVQMVERRQPRPVDRYRVAWEIMERSFGDCMSAKFRAMRDAWLASVDALAAWSIAAPRTVRHGDFKADNLLFAPCSEADAIVALDWQSVSLSKAVTDVAYFITHNMGVEKRKAHEQELLRLYAERIGEYGVDYPWAVLIDEYRTALLSNLSYIVHICGVNVNSNPKAIIRKQRLVERISSSIEDWNLVELLPFKANVG